MLSWGPQPFAGTLPLTIHQRDLDQPEALDDSLAYDGNDSFRIDPAACFIGSDLQARAVMSGQNFAQMPWSGTPIAVPDPMDLSEQPLLIASAYPRGAMQRPSQAHSASCSPWTCTSLIMEPGNPASGEITRYPGSESAGRHRSDPFITSCKNDCQTSRPDTGRGPIGSDTKQIQCNTNSQPEDSASAMPNAQITRPRVVSEGPHVEDESPMVAQPTVFALTCTEPGMMKYPSANVHRPRAERAKWWALAEKHCRESWGRNINLSRLPKNDLLTAAREPRSMEANFNYEVEKAWGKVKVKINEYEASTARRRCCQELEQIVSCEVEHRLSNQDHALTYRGSYSCLIHGLSSDDAHNTPRWCEIVIHQSALPERTTEWKKRYTAMLGARHRANKRTRVGIQTRSRRSQLGRESSDQQGQSTIQGGALQSGYPNACRIKATGQMHAGYTIFSELHGRPGESADRPLYSLGFSKGRRGWWSAQHGMLLNAAASPGLKSDKCVSAYPLIWG